MLEDEINKILEEYFCDLKNLIKNKVKLDIKEYGKNIFNHEKKIDTKINDLFNKYEELIFSSRKEYNKIANFIAEQHEKKILEMSESNIERVFLKFIKVEFMHGVEEPWCNNQGVAILPYVIKDNEYYFLLVKELNTLYSEEPTWATITGGLEKYELIQTVINEMWEETSIDITNWIHKINYNSTYYANKSSTKLWHLFYIDLTELNLDLNKTYKGTGDGTEAEKNTFAKFFNHEEMNSESRDLFCLAICQKIFKHIENQNKLSVQDNIEQINNQSINTNLINQPSTSTKKYHL
ncbi:MAG: NUDIX hydrolase [Spiroplasma ixodetis]|nr:NUDIX hydrolase [Spiroplasma ixodetis]MBP1528519.1 NUDIX hydrolase [Spiroplasma ixodetis]